MPVIQSKRPLLGASRSDSTVRRKNLLADEDTPTATEEVSLDDFVIVDCQYDYPIEDVVPAGYYASKIKNISVRIKNGKKMLDVGYMLEAMVDGEIYRILQTYPLNSKPYKAFCNAMIAAGVKPGHNIKDVVGVTEKIQLAYWSETSNFGSIVKRIYHDDPEFPDPDSIDPDDVDDDDLLTDED